MTDKKANKLALISFITGVGVIFAIFVVANLFPNIQVTKLRFNIIIAIMTIPWISFLIFIALSSIKKDK